MCGREGVERRGKKGEGEGEGRYWRVKGEDGKIRVG